MQHPNYTYDRIIAMEANNCSSMFELCELKIPSAFVPEAYVYFCSPNNK